MTETNNLENDLINQINNIIENGIHVDKTLRVPSSYSYVTLLELKTEVFVTIVDLLQNRDIPLWLCQKIAWYYMKNDYNLTIFEDLIESKSKDDYQMPILDEEKEIKVINRTNLVSQLRKSISVILSNWFTNNLDFLKERQERKSQILDFNHFGIKNKRRSMEDRIAIYDDLNMFFEDELSEKSYSFLKKPHALFAIFDGHSGTEAAQYVSSHLPLYIVQHEFYETDLKRAIVDSFEKINKRLLSKESAESFRSGTTCSLCIVRDQKLHVAWCGDSQTCLVKQNKPYYITEPHKPNNEKEKERIEKLGGCVIYTSKDWRVNGQLAIARTFGDIDHQPYVNCDPDYIEFDLDGEEDYFILGCDGLWEHSNINEHLNEMCDFIKKTIKETKSTKTISEVLVSRAQEFGSGDNISVIFVMLKNIFKHN